MCVIIDCCLFSTARGRGGNFARRGGQGQGQGF